MSIYINKSIFQFLGEINYEKEYFYKILDLIPNKYLFSGGSNCGLNNTLCFSPGFDTSIYFHIQISSLEELTSLLERYLKLKVFL